MAIVADPEKFRQFVKVFVESGNAVRGKKSSF
jgi:hypothetical protein